MTTTEHGADEYSRALAHFQAGQYGEALPLLQAHALRFPDEKTIYGIAMCHARLGRWAEAERTLEQLVQEHPGRPEYAAELANVRTRAHRASGDVQAATMGADTSGARRATLAGMLEDEGSSDYGMEDFTGDLLLRRHRLLLSHKRLWLGGLLIVALPVLGFLEGQVRDASVIAPEGIRTVAADVLGVLASLALLVLLTAAGLVAFALLSSRLTTYVVWAHRMDITTGVLFRRHRTVWLYKLTDVQLVQNPVLLLAGTAALVLHVDEATPTTKRPPQLVGLGPTSAMQRLQGQILFLAAQERRGMKKQFI